MFKKKFVEVCLATDEIDSVKKFTVEGHNIVIKDNVIIIDDEEIVLPPNIRSVKTIASVTNAYLHNKQVIKKKPPMLLIDYISKVKLDGPVYAEFVKNFPANDQSPIEFKFYGISFTRVISGDDYLIGLSKEFDKDKPFNENIKKLSRRCPLKKMIGTLFTILNTYEKAKRKDMLKDYGPEISDWFIEYFEKNKKTLNRREINDMLVDLTRLVKDGHGISDIPERFAKYSNVKTAVWSNEKFSAMMLACHEHFENTGIDVPKGNKDQAKTLRKALSNSSKKPKTIRKQKISKSSTGLCSMGEVLAGLNL